MVLYLIPTVRIVFFPTVLRIHCNVVPCFAVYYFPSVWDSIPPLTEYLFSFLGVPHYYHLWKFSVSCLIFPSYNHQVCGSYFLYSLSAQLHVFSNSTITTVLIILRCLIWVIAPLHIGRYATKVSGALLRMSPFWIYGEGLRGQLMLNQRCRLHRLRRYEDTLEDIIWTNLLRIDCCTSCRTICRHYRTWMRFRWRGGGWWRIIVQLWWKADASPSFQSLSYIALVQSVFYVP